MTDAPSTSASHRPYKRKASGYYNSSKRLRCGPNSYLIVGNKHDPLNLESNDYEPPVFNDQYSPSPLDRTDPLNLNSPPKNAKKKKKKHKNDKWPIEETLNPVFVSQRRFSVVQQKIKQSYLQHSHQQTSNSTEKQVPTVQNQHTIANNNKYRFGNFNRYYGNRPQLAIIDQRLNFLCRDMFVEKDILDVGCNSGLLTISIAREFAPRRIIGMDIDGHLIRAAQQNVRYFCDKDMKFMHRFPMSFPHCFGPITAAPTGESEEFPHNVKFIVDNYVLENDEQLDNVKPEYDVILLLSTSKWIHLNYGDDGLKRAFKRMHRQLLPKGKLILEVLTFDTYQRSANSCNILRNNFEKITLKPDQFRDYLLSDEVGFRHCEDVGLAYAGFKGPLLIFFKEDIVFTHETNYSEVSWESESETFVGTE